MFWFAFYLCLFIVWLLPPSPRANKACSAKHLSGGTNSQPMSGQRNHSPFSAKASFVQTLPRPRIAWLPPNPPKTKKMVCTCMFDHRTSITALKELLTNSRYDPQMTAWQLFLYFFYSIGGDVVFLSCDKCTHCKSLWTKASAKCPECKCKIWVSAYPDIVLLVS